MPFQKNNKLGAKSLNEEPFDKSPLSFAVKKGVKEKLKTVPNWQERLRKLVDELIEESEDTCQ